MEELSDEAIMAKVGHGKIELLGLLFERYKVVLYNYFYHFSRQKDLAQDLVQELFERLWRYRRSYDVSRRFKPWMMTMARNLLNDHFSKSRTHVEVESIDLEVQMPSDDQKDTLLMLQKLLNSLDDVSRQVVNMYYIVEMNHSDIAETLGISVNTSRIKLCRALKKMNEMVSKNELI